MNFKKIGKKLLLGIISLVVVLTYIEFGVRAESTDEVIYDTEPTDIATFRANDVYSAPEKEDYVFGGWYKLNGDKYEAMTKEEANTANTAYAKWVPKAVLSVKAQVNEAAINNEINNNAAIRLLTTVDSLDYDVVGFKVKIGNGAEVEYSSGSVFGKIRVEVGGTAEGGYREDYSPKVFSDASDYFESISFTNIPGADVDIEIKATPYWVTLDGTKVEGGSSIKTVNLGRSWVYVDSSDEDSAELGTKNDPYTTIAAGVAHPSEIAVKAIIKDSDDTKIENITLDNAIVVDKTYPVTIASEAEATIVRKELAKAMFSVSEGAELILDGTLTLDGNSSSSSKATEAMLLNQGTLTVGSGVTIQKGYKEGNNSLVSGKTWNGGAIENIGTLNLYGTITTSGSTNGSAICSTNLDTEDNTVTLKIKDADLSGNVGRALRIVYGVAIIEDTTINENDGADGGGALLIDYADVTIRGGFCNNNSSTSNGGAIKLTNANAKLTLDSCTISGNEANTQGGGIMLSKATNILTLKGTTTISDNVGTVGTQIYTHEADSTINWGSDVQMSAIDSGSKGMLGLNKASVKIVLAGAMNELNNISVVGNSSKLSAGNMILFGNNPWIENAADNFVVLSSSGLKVRIDGKLTSSDAETKVSTWSELKEIVADATSGNTLEVVLDSDIPSTDDGAITIPAGVKIILTDEGKGYSIKRTATTETSKKDALFKVVGDAEMILAGNITLDGDSSSEDMANESLILNQGTLTVNSNVTIQKGYKEAEKTSLDDSKDSLSGGAIESNGALNIYGTITACGSGNNSAISVLDGTFTANGAKLNANQGRAARIVDGEAALISVEITNNAVSEDGGGLLIDYAAVTINGGSISSNEAIKTGAGVRIQGDATLTMANCNLDGNTATTNGGAIYSNGSGKIVLRKCTIGKVEKNKANNGGAIFVGPDSTSDIEIEESVFVNNEAVANGGVIYNQAKSGTISFANCKMGVDDEGNVAGNSAKGGGAIYMNSAGTMNLEACIISNNKSGDNRGGAVRSEKGTLVMSNCTMNKNYSSKSGGAFFIYTNGSVELVSCTMIQNSTLGDGQTIDVWGTLKLVDECRIENELCTLENMSDNNFIYVKTGASVTYVSE